MDLANLTLHELTAGFETKPDSCFGQPAEAKLGAATLRRCRTREQGAALLTVSHAIEYLLDSQLSKDSAASIAEREALAILLTANLAVYREGAEIIPLGDRLRQWFRGGAAKKNVAGATA